MLEVQISWDVLLDRFLLFSDPSIEFPFGPPDVEFVVIFIRNGIDYTTYVFDILKWNL